MSMKIELNAVEVRVLGCLIEKDLTTPEYYPLSLNALTNACNQKSNRDPLMSLSDQEVQAALDSLIKNHLAAAKSSAGSRVGKFAHRMNNPITQTMNFSRQEQAVLAELFLRGPQTVGELRTRASRMAEFTDTSHVESVLKGLAGRDDGPFVIELPRQPGRREPRVAHLFSGVPSAEAFASEPAATPEPGQSGGRIDQLEKEVAELRAEVSALRQQIQQLIDSETAEGGIQ